MGRYDQAKSKKSGRYGRSKNHQARNRDSTGISISAVIVLIILASAGGFYFATQLTNGVTLPELNTLLTPFNDNTEEQAVTDSDVKTDVAGTESIADEKQTAVDIEAAPDNLEELQQEEQIILPLLDSSDESFRSDIMKLSPGLALLVNTEHLISQYVVIANDFSQGLRIENHMRFLKLAEPFVADQSEKGLFIAEKSYRRYDKLAAAIDAMDVQATLAVYKKFKPLLMQVLAEFSYPEDIGLEDIFTKAAAEILAAPVIEEPIALVKPSIRYKFADSRLEGLNPVHKQMIRMGPENTQIIQSKVRMLVEELANLKE